MSIANRHIMDIYHAHAYSDQPDDWARRHVHGLNRSYLKENGFPSEEAIVKDFKTWLRRLDVLCMFANAPQREYKLLGCSVINMGIPPWIDRVSLLSHQMAHQFKTLELPITALTKYVACSKDAHQDFKCVPTPHNSATELAKKHFGYHCSLYDVYALYLHYLADARESSSQ